MKKEAPGRCFSVNAVGDALEMHLLGLKFIYEVDQSFHAAPEPIQSPDNEGIAFGGLFDSMTLTRIVEPSENRIETSRDSSEGLQLSVL